MAKSVAYPISAEMVAPSHWTVRAFSNKADAIEAHPKSKELSMEDVQIVAALNEAAYDMAHIHSCFDHITEEILIDCLIYELKAVTLRHKFFLDLCKEKNIVGCIPV